VLLDMHMPELDGYRTAEIIRHSDGQNGEEPQLKLIAMTANRTPGDRERCLAAGMNDYLSKPVNQNDLGRVLHRWNPAEEQMA
jgi:CheY-like chemotaxis protein